MSNADAAGARESPSSSTDALQKNACVLCQQRKVKCNRTEPCSNCEKAEKPCEYRAPPPPKRRPRKAPELGLHARVKRYEQLLKKFGVKVEDLTADEEHDADHMVGVVEQETAPLYGVATTTEHPSRFPPRGEGRLVVSKNGGSTRYVETNMWKDVHDIDRADADSASSEDDDNIGVMGKRDDPTIRRSGDPAHFIIGGFDSGININNSRPPASIARRLWEIFVENVDPLVKLFHPPTVEKLLSSHFDDPDSHIPKNLCPLAFSIFLFAITSMSQEEVEHLTGESKSIVLIRYREACQISLMRGGLLRTADIVVLQAFTLFLLSIRQYCDAPTLWVLSGIALRISQRMGLNHDGEGTELPPFQVEMRRRLWWQIVVLDRTNAEISGAGVYASAYDWDTKRPLNVEDDELHPDMNELPPEKEGATGMMFSLMRYELGDFFRSIHYMLAPHGLAPEGMDSGTLAASLQRKDNAIEQLQRRFEQKYLRYCDPLNKLHFLSSVVARSILCMLTLVTHHPRQYPDKGASLPQSERDLLFTKALKIIEYGNLLQNSPLVKGYLWHINVFFTWQAFIFLLDWVVQNPNDRGADEAWSQLDQVYRNHPTLITETTNSLHTAVRRLTLKGWDGREARFKAEGRSYQVPEFVKYLRDATRDQRMKGSRRERQFRHMVGPFKAVLPVEGDAPETVPKHSPSSIVTPDGSGGFSDPNSFSNLETPTDWSQWDDLIGGFGFDWQNSDQSALGFDISLWNYGINFGSQPQQQQQQQQQFQQQQQMLHQQHPPQQQQQPY